jgi:hypothetical protein
MIFPETPFGKGMGRRIAKASLLPIKAEQK